MRILCMNRNNVSQEESQRSKKFCNVKKGRIMWDMIIAQKHLQGNTIKGKKNYSKSQWRKQQGAKALKLRKERFRLDRHIKLRIMRRLEQSWR